MCIYASMYRIESLCSRKAFVAFNSSHIIWDYSPRRQLATFRCVYMYIYKYIYIYTHTYNVMCVCVYLVMYIYI